jgi:hypothetical protein
LINQKIPDWERQPAILSKPELNYLFEQPYVDAFYTLSSSRQFATGGISTIPVSEILIYWDHFQLDTMENFLEIMRNVDNAYVKMWYDDPANKPKGSE